MTPAQARRQRAQLMREIAREHKRADRTRLVSLRDRLRAARTSRAAAIRRAREACKRRGKVPTMREAAAMLRAARLAARRQCDVDLAAAAKVKDATDRARRELETEQRHQRELRRIESGNKARALEQKKTSARTRQGESDDEVRGNIPPELVALFERVKRQIKGSDRVTRTEAFLAYAEEHPDEEIAALEDRTDEIIRQLEARERGEPMRRNPKKKPPPMGPACEAKALRRKVRMLQGELRAKKARRANPRRPPSRWWEACLASVSAQHHARDPAAVCGETWWRLPAKRRAAIVRSMERGSPRNRRRAVALAKAERNRHDRARSGKAPKRSKKKKTKPRRPNPPLYAVAYVEKKKGDRRPHVYEHVFSTPRPRLIIKGDDVRIVRKNSSYSTREGWIHG